MAARRRRHGRPGEALDLEVVDPIVVVGAAELAGDRERQGGERQGGERQGGGQTTPGDREALLCERPAEHPVVEALALFHAPELRGKGQTFEPRQEPGDFLVVLATSSGSTAPEMHLAIISTERWSAAVTFRLRRVRAAPGRFRTAGPRPSGSRGRSAPDRSSRCGRAA